MRNSLILLEKPFDSHISVISRHKRGHIKAYISDIDISTSLCRRVTTATTCDHGTKRYQVGVEALLSLSIGFLSFTQ